MELDIVAGGPKRHKRAINLPDEIVNEILVLLPARSVLRFRAVCRQWAAHLSSPGFTAAYAAKSKARRMSKLVVFGASPGHLSTAFYSCSSQGDAATDPLFTVDGLRADFVSLSSRPSRSLVLFRDTRTVSGDNWVCNPSTGECRALPRQRPRGMIMMSSAGLVVDDRTKECKAVHLFITKYTGLECQVYTLGDSECRWRAPTTDIQSLGTNKRNMIVSALKTEDAVTKVPPVPADGCLHWLIYPSYSESRDAILRFSATDESFDFVAVPPVSMGEVGTCWEEHSPAVPFHLAEIKGSLCMVHDLRRRHPSHGGSSLDVWVLRDCIGVGRVWSLDYRIAVGSLLARDVHSPRFITVLGCYGGGGTCEQDEKLLVATSEHKVYAYMPDTGRAKIVFSAEDTAIGLQKEAVAGLCLGIYEDSLVKIEGERDRREREVSSAVIEVLMRLPLKSIAQSMLVCRELCTLIESESFVATQMSMKRSVSILMATDGRAQRAFFHFAPLDNWLDQASNPGLPGSSHINGKIICSKPCNGLNLISTSSDDYLCNPYTGAVQCLGIRGRSFCNPRFSNGKQLGGHAFTVGRNIGFGFDISTGEHVAVEIGHLHGALACMVKTSESDAWTCVGTPPMPVTDMPPAHVDGTLYWMGEQMQACIVIVAFDITRRVFRVLPYEQPMMLQNKDHGAFLVELNGKLSLVLADHVAEEMKIWTMHERGAWVNDHTLCLRGQPDFSPRRTVVVPLEVSLNDSRILLNTGRALGYYDTKTGALDTLYSLDNLQFPLINLAFPMLCQESLVRVRHDLDHRIALPPVASGHISRRRSCEHPEHAVAVDNEAATPRPIFQRCQKPGCLSGYGETYSNCCKRVMCSKCLLRCLEHYQGVHVPLNNLNCENVINSFLRHGLPLDHPFVPDPDYYCYYYSAIHDDVVRHVFVAIRDVALGKQPCHLTECAYTMDGHGAVRKTWVRRCLKIDYGRDPLP